jgi:ATP-dependent exoDNAse (exonuclease V) beta subunit
MNSDRFDEDQKRAVAVSTNAVVAAGAGSGKTTVLAGRFLRLVREGAEVPGILTLTFTRKAAAEMYTRIHRLLASHADEPRIRAQLSLFDQARISTLDSFCSRIARSDAAAFGMPLSFGIDQEGLAKAADSLALEFILEHHRHPALKGLIAANGFETVWKEFFGRYAVQELLITDSPAHAANFHRQEEACRLMVKESFTLLGTLYARMAGASDGKGSTAAAAGAAAEAWPDTDDLIVREAWDDLTECAERRPYRKPGSNVKDPDLLILRDIHEELDAASDKAVSALAVLSNGGLQRGVMELMDQFALRWQELKRRRGVVSFGDVVSMAVRLLTENRELRDYYKQQFSHIMIDEFQDNNETQKKLLYLLAERLDRSVPGIPSPQDLEREKLFFVGDEKQSIYRFRGADVSVFKRLSRDFGGQPIELGTNYRSDPRLIGFFNEFFPRVFEREAGGKDFEAEFRPLKGRPEAPGAPVPEVRLACLAPGETESGEEYLSAIESEAWEAARIIRNAVDGKSLLLPGEKGPRPAVWNDFALLMRSTGNQIVFEAMFRRFGIPYSTENIRTLFLEAPANDIYAALQICIYPEDRAAYAVFLRSLFVNLDDENLLRELSAHGAPFTTDASQLSEGEAGKYLRGAEIYRHLKKRIDRIPHREILRYLWFEAGYRYNLLKNPAYHGYLEFYEYLTAMADRSWKAGESMALFLDFLRDNLGDYKKLEEIEILRDRQEGVRIMTVHKSKGLEFPIVLLASTGQGSGDTGMRAPWYLDRDYGLTVNLALRTGKGKQKYNPFYERSREEALRQEEAELKRLLYVGCTRAEQHLIMLGHRPLRKSGSLPSLLDLIETGLGAPCGEAGSARSAFFAPVPRQRLSDLAKHSPRGRRLGEYEQFLKNREFIFPLRRRPLSVSILNAAAAESAGGRTEPLSRLSVDPLIAEREELFGTLVHRALELRIKGRDPRSGLEPPAGLPPETAREIADAASSLAAEFWDSPARLELIPDGIEVVSEAPFSLLLETDSGPVVSDGVIDLYADLGDYVVCVDFKTNRGRREGEYAMQMWLYRRALEELTGKPVRSCLVYLREGVPRPQEVNFSIEELELLAARCYSMQSEEQNS